MNSPTTARPAAGATPVPAGALGSRKDLMSVADFNALKARKAPAKGKTSPDSSAPRSAAVIDKEAAARRAVVGVGRLAWTNHTFGVPLPCRKFLLADEGQAARLDELFYHLTGTQPT